MTTTATLFPSSIHPVPPMNSSQHVLFKNPQFFHGGSRILFSFLYVPFSWWEEKCRWRVEDQSRGSCVLDKLSTTGVHPLISTIYLSHRAVIHSPPYRPYCTPCLTVEGVWKLILRKNEVHSDPVCWVTAGKSANKSSCSSVRASLGLCAVFTQRWGP